MPVNIKAKMSKSAWVLIALLVFAIIALPILHFTGIIDLSFFGVGYMEILKWSADAPLYQSPLNGALTHIGVFAAGMLTWYVLKKYIFGTQVPTAGVYPPIGQTISQPQQQQEETVVSS